MASIPPNSQDAPSADNIMPPLLTGSTPKLQSPSSITDGPLPTLRTPGNQSEVAHGQNELFPEKQPVVQSNRPLPDRQVSTISPPIGQFTINMLLQIAAFAAAIAFGIFAVKSVRVGYQANSYANQAVELAVTANQLAMLSLCLSSGNQTPEIGSVCSMVVNGAGSMITTAASALFTNLPTNAGTTSSTSTTSGTGTSSSTSTTSRTITPTSISSSAGLNAGSIIGVAVSSVILGLIILVGIAIFCLRHRRRSSRRIDLTDTEAHRPLLKWSSFGNSFRQLFMDTQVITQTK